MFPHCANILLLFDQTEGSKLQWQNKQEVKHEWFSFLYGNVVLDVDTTFMTIDSVTWKQSLQLRFIVCMKKYWNGN